MMAIWEERHDAQVLLLDFVERELDFGILRRRAPGLRSVGRRREFGTRTNGEISAPLVHA